MTRYLVLILKLFVSGSLLAMTAWPQTESGWRIHTVAGTGKPGFHGDNGPAVEAQLDFPVGVAVDKAANLYIADSFNQRIRRVDSSGTITTIAGTGKPGFDGDGGPAIQARLSFPSDVAVDKAANLYIADSGNNSIRRVDASGTITTIAGTGERGFFWDVGPAVEAKLDRPRGVAVDKAANLYIAGELNLGIRRVDASGTMSTVGGTQERLDELVDSPGYHEYTRDRRVEVDRSDNLYIANIDNNYVRRVDASGTATLIAGTRRPGYGGDGGTAAEAQLNFPAGLAVDKAGNVYIADTGNHRIRRIDASGTIRTIAGTGEPGFSGDGGPATKAQLSSPIALAVDGAGNLYVADLGNYRIRVLTPPPDLNFAHFANGASITSDLVLVNVGTAPIRPTVYFYNKEGHLIPGESIVDVRGDLESQQDGAIIVRTKMEPLGDLTISTHGRGELVTGSVRVEADGPIGGVLRFDIPEIGVAGVGASQSVRDAIFPARRKEGGINTGAAIRNLGEDPIVVSCQLMQEGTELEEKDIPLDGNGQTAKFIQELFTKTDTSDFVGSVRCTAPDGGMFTGVALEMDPGNRIFTTLPLVPVATEEQAASLDFAHFANGESITSEVVLVNVSGAAAAPTLFFYDPKGNAIAGDSVVDLTGDLALTDEGALTIGTKIKPLGERTISTTGEGMLRIGSARVVSDGPLGGVLRFNAPAIGVAGVGASQPVAAAVFPARRQAGGINTGAAIRNLEADPMTLTCQLMRKGAVLEEKEIPLAANGQVAKFIDEIFETDTSDFVGAVRCSAPDEGRFTGVALEMDPGNRIFTTLPVIPVSR